MDQPHPHDSYQIRLYQKSCSFIFIPYNRTRFETNQKILGGCRLPRCRRRPLAIDGLDIWLSLWVWFVTSPRLKRGFALII